jgi:hypothetical protein
MDLANDPIVHGKTVSTLPGSTTGPARDLHQGDKGSGDASHNCQSVPPSNVTDADSDNKTETGGVESKPSPSTATIPAASSTATSSSSTNKPDHENQPGNLEAREEGPAESSKRKRAETAIERMARLMDSDEEQERWRAVSARFDAEQARREALSPEERDREDTECQAGLLRSHIEPQLEVCFDGVAHLDYYPIFQFQKAPHSHNGATCRFIHCTNRIVPGQYRIALSPGMSDPRGPGEIASCGLTKLPGLTRPQSITMLDASKSCSIYHLHTMWRALSLMG